MPHASVQSVAQEYLNRRQHEREDVFLHTVISIGRDDYVPADLVNISTSGFLVRCNRSFQRKDRLRIALPMLGDMPAEVMWCLAGCVGCQLVYPVKEQDFPRLLAEIRRAPRNWFEQNIR